jgi:DNA end-binding protein Ku
MAQQLIESLSADFDPTKFKDEYRERVLDLIERKAAGEEIAVQPEAEDETPAPDLMAALEASLAEIRSGDSDEPAPKKAPAKSRKRSSSSDDDSAKSSGTSKSGGSSKSSAKGNGSSSSNKSRAKAKS